MKAWTEVQVKPIDDAVTAKDERMKYIGLRGHWVHEPVDLPTWFRKIGHHSHMDLDDPIHTSKWSCCRCPNRRRKNLDVPILRHWAKFQAAYQSQLSVAFETLLLVRVLTSYDVVTDLLLIGRLAESVDDWWLAIAVGILFIPIILKALLIARISIRRLSRPTQARGFGLNWWASVLLYVMFCLPFVFVVDFYLLLFHPCAPPQDLEVLGTLERFSPLFETLESICQTAFSTYMFFREKDLGRALPMTETELALFAWLPSFLSLCKKVPQLRDEAAQVGLPVGSYLLELIRAPLGLSVPLLYLLSTREEVSYCGLGYLAGKQQNQLWQCILSGDAEARVLRFLAFDSSNEVDLGILASALNQLKLRNGIFLVQLPDEWEGLQGDVFSHLLANPLLNVSINRCLYKPCDSSGQTVDQLPQGWSLKKLAIENRIWASQKAGMHNSPNGHTEHDSLPPLPKELYTAAILRECGMPVGLTLNTGFSPKQMKQVGYTPKDFAAFMQESKSHAKLRRNCKWIPPDFKDFLGDDFLADVKDTFTLAEWKQDGVSALDLTALGWAQEELDTAGRAETE